MSTPHPEPATDRARLVGHRRDRDERLLAPALATIAVEHSRREIVVPDPAPIVAYVASSESLYEPAVPDGTRWADVLAEVEAAVAAVIERDGAFTVHSDGAMMLCRAA